MIRNKNGNLDRKRHLWTVTAMLMIDPGRVSKADVFSLVLLERVVVVERR